MSHLVCACDSCWNRVTEDDYCSGCGCYICEEHRSNTVLSEDHDPEEHWEFNSSWEGIT